LLAVHLGQFHIDKVPVRKHADFRLVQPETACRPCQLDDLLRLRRLRVASGSPL
jgi:hypothetical protein